MTSRQDLVACGLDQLSIGFGIFDAEQRLVSCNSPFKTLRDYPEELCIPGISLEALIAFNANRGDFGSGDAHQQTIERINEIQLSGEREIEREMSNGQILSISYRNMENGGLLVVFEDKTQTRRAEKALALSEERYALISDAAEEAIYEWDIENDRFHASAQMEKLLGVEIDPAGERNWKWEAYVHPEDLSHYKKTLTAHRAGKRSKWHCEYRLRNSDGDYRWVLDHGTSIRDNKSQAVRMVAAIKDITERVERENALAASEERHQLITKASSDGIYDWNVAADSLFVSDKLKQMFGFKNELLESRTWANSIHQEDKERYIAVLRSHFKGETDSIECEYRISSPDGVYRWVRDQGVGVRDPGGRVKRLVGAVRDITDMKSAEKELDHAEKRLRASLETISEGFLLVDPQDRVQIWNKRYLEIFGNAAGADIQDIVVKGKPFIDMIYEGYERGIFKPHAGGAEGWIAERRENRESKSSQLEMELSNKRWLSINERRMSDGGRVSVYNDITEFKRREEELKAIQARFEDAIEAMSSGFALFDAEDKMVVHNTKYQEYFPGLADVFRPGISFTEIVKTALERGLFPEASSDPDAWLSALLESRALAAGPREQFMDGGLWLQVSDHITKDGGIVSIYTDVTELKERESELRTQSAVLEATLENMGQGITMVDKELNVVMFNKKFLEYFDFPESEFQRGFHMSQAFRLNAERGEYGEGDIDDQIAERLALSAEFLPHRFERTRPDGITLEIVGNPVEKMGFVTTYTDITERTAANQKLRDREVDLNTALQELNAVLDTIDYGVLFMGADLRGRVINRAFANLWGMSQDLIDRMPTMGELIDYNRESGLYDVAPKDWDAWRSERIEIVQNGDFGPVEMPRADGKVLQFQCIALPDGGRMLTYYDITDLKRREADLTATKNAAEQALQDLQNAQDRLVQAEKMASLGQLTAGIAHEIKNPLNFVNNFSNLSVELLEELADVLRDPMALLDEESKDDAEDLFTTVKSNLSKINEHGRRADSIVKNMLLHSREGPGELQSLDLNGIVEEALNLAFHGARAEDSNFNIEMKKNLSSEVGEIECFPQDLMRVFLNLISNGMYAANARKTEHGNGIKTIEPEISVETRNQDANVIVEVRDNGAGISAELQEKIFTPFFTTKPAGEGTGLGLSLSYDIVVKQHGGMISVDSELGEFTAFRVVLPRIHAHTAMAGETA